MKITKILCGMCLAASLFLFAAPVNGQNTSPLGGVGSLQFFSDTGKVLTGGYVYIYQAGTSTPVAVYFDATGTTQLPNPVPLGSNGRTPIWIANGTFVKVILSASNLGGAACNGSDVLFSADQVPIGSSGGGGASCGAGCTGIFISSTASPATSGVLRLASGDSVCYRNAAGSSNICFSKDSTDILSWGGGSIKLPEVGTPSGQANFDILWADNTAHRFKAINNNGTAAQLVLSGNDINAQDSVTAWHFGATQTPLSSTAPTTGQVLQWNGSAIVGVSSTPEFTMTSLQMTGNFNYLCPSAALSCPVYFFTSAHTLKRLVSNMSTAVVSCTTNPVYGVQDVTASINLATLTPTTLGLLDSGPLSILMPAGHQYALGLLTQGVGCTNTGTVGALTATYQ